MIDINDTSRMMRQLDRMDTRTPWDYNIRSDAPPGNRKARRAAQAKQK